MTKISACVLLPLFFANAYAAESDSWICIGDKAVGFFFNRATKQWEPTTFQAGKKYLLSRPKVSGHFKPEWKWEVTRFGDDFPWTTCNDDFTDAGTLFCVGGISFSFNRKNLRFMAAYEIGYIYQGSDPKTDKPVPEGSDTPSLEIGTCASMP